MGTRHWPEDATEAVELLEQQLAEAQEVAASSQAREAKLMEAIGYLHDSATTLEGAVSGLSLVLSCYRTDNSALLAYGLAQKREALEAAAKVCETPIDEIQITDDCKEYVYPSGADCAAAIRRMIGELE